MFKKILAGYRGETGKPLEYWINIVKRSGLSEKKEIAAFLKNEHNIPAMYANTAANRALGIYKEDDYDPLQCIKGQFAGKKETLLPLYEQLLEISLSLGEDIRICPCKTFVPVYRKHVIAQIKPAAQTRIDFGLALAGLPTEGRLISTGGYDKKDRITHRIPVASREDIDDELMSWLKTAYEMNA